MSVETPRQQCDEFFSNLKEGKLLKSVFRELGDELADLVVSNGYSPRASKSGDDDIKKKFRGFDVGRGKCLVGQDLCQAVKVTLPMLPALRKIEGVRKIYEDAFKRPFDLHDGGTGYGLFQPSDGIDAGEDPKLLGDYLFYRMERRRTTRNLRDRDLMVSRSFIRFYKHKWRGLRFMFLSIATAEKYLAARGWVHDLGNCYLSGGSIIDRRSEDIEEQRIFGGMSGTIVMSDRRSKFCRIKKREADSWSIEAAPTLHVRAIDHQKPSLGRGYLVRCFGAQNFGGDDNQTEAQRHAAIRDLQRRLGEIYPSDASPVEAAAELARATGYSDDVFFRSADNDSGASGLLVNIPFREPNETGPYPGPLILPEDVHFDRLSKGKSTRKKSKIGVELKL